MCGIHDMMELFAQSCKCKHWLMVSAYKYGSKSRFKMLHGVFHLVQIIPMNTVSQISHLFFNLQCPVLLKEEVKIALKHIHWAAELRIISDNTGLYFICLYM